MGFTAAAGYDSVWHVAPVDPAAKLFKLGEPVPAGTGEGFGLFPMDNVCHHQPYRGAVGENLKFLSQVLETSTFDHPLVAGLWRRRPCL